MKKDKIILILALGSIICLGISNIILVRTIKRNTFISEHHIFTTATTTLPIKN